MTHRTSYPGADTTTRPKGDGNATLARIDKVVLHTTEGDDGLPSYADNWPNLTYDPWHRRWYQHTPINGSATSLENDGNHQTNRASVVQVEIMGTCDPVRQSSPFHVSKIPQAALDDLGAFLAWMNTEWEVPLTATSKWVANANTASVRMSWDQYTAFRGVLGHQHVPGNSHFDPGVLNVDAIMAAATGSQHDEPAVGVTFQLMNLNCQWPGFASTQAVALPWSERCSTLADAIATADPSVVTAQELGHDEAADLAAALGSRWHYQRSGLNTVLWRDEWELEGDTREWELSSFGQKQRTLIACKLRHHTGSYVWAASTHLAAKASDLSADKAIKARRKQAEEVGSIFDSYRQIVLGADLNSSDHDTVAGSPRAVLRADGWTTDSQAVAIAGLDLDTKGGIDAVLTKKRCQIKGGRIIPLGSGSDHDGRLATVRTTR